MVLINMKTILQFAIALVLILSAFGLKAQDGSEYLLWEKSWDYEIRVFTFSPDETQIALVGDYSNSDSDYVKILNVKTGEELYSKCLYGPWRLFYTTDGRYLVVRCASNLILDAKTYAVIKKLPTGEISFSADNQFLAIAEVKGYSRVLRIYNSNTFEKVFEKEYLPEEADICNIFLFYTPIGDNLIVNAEYLVKHPGPGDQYSRIRTASEVFDSKTFQLLDKKIKCLSDIFFGTSFVLSKNGLVAKTILEHGDYGTSLGFRIYDYNKDSLIWEQETNKCADLIFLNTKNYLISKYSVFESSNPEMKVFTTWNLSNLQQDKNIFCAHKSSPKISKSDKYLCATNTVTLWLYDFENMFEANVSVTEQTQTPSNIEIISNAEINTIAINFLENNNESMNITLYNLSGNLVDVIYSGIPSGKIEYSTAHLAKGVYLVKVDTGKKTETKKIVIN